MSTFDLICAGLIVSTVAIEGAVDAYDKMHDGKRARAAFYAFAACGAALLSGKLFMAAIA